MVQVRLLQADLPKNQRTPITEAVRLLYERSQKNFEKNRSSREHSGRGGKATARDEFVRVLKGSLDKSLEPGWHVLCGKTAGFACKKRDGTVAVFRLVVNASQQLDVIIWKSPGLEVLTPEDTKEPETSSADGNNHDSVVQEDVSSEAPAEDCEQVQRGKNSLNVLEPSSVEPGSGEDRTIQVLRACTENLGKSEPDVKALAQDIRRALTAELGTIWHVIVGSDFSAEVAEDRRNCVLAVVGKTRILCFQHEQFTKSSIDYVKIIKALPYLIFVFLFFAYISLRNSCSEEALQAGSLTWIQKQICSTDWEQYLAGGAACVLASLFMGKKAGTIFSTKRVKID